MLIYDNITPCSEVHPAKLQQCSSTIGDHERRIVLKQCKDYRAEDLSQHVKGDLYGCEHCWIQGSVGRCELKPMEN